MTASIPPSRLYKYQPYTTQTLDNLKNRQIWFSKPRAFNDPFDAAIDPMRGQMTDAELLEVLAEYLAGESEHRQQLEKAYLTDGKPNDLWRTTVLKGAKVAAKHQLDTNQERGLACFAERNDDLLLWAHYAHGHRGFCLEFDTSFDPFTKARPVVYAKEYPSLSIAEALRTNKSNVDAWLLTKYETWIYEREWRVLHSNGDTAYGVGVMALTGVYFGCAMPFEHVEIIALILMGSPTKLYEMKRSETDFKVVPLLTQYTPYDYSADTSTKKTPA